MGGPTIVHGSVSGAETPRGYQEDGDQELPDGTPHHLQHSCRDQCLTCGCGTAVPG
jgi:hypothetical protein